MKCVGFGLVALFLCAATAAAQYTFVVTEHKGGWSSTTQGFADGTKFRLEPQESKTADNPQGMYAISLDSGRTVYLVNPARQEFARVDFQTLMAKAAEKLKALMEQMNLQIESPKVETVLTEPGGTLDGHPTRHYKLRVSYLMHYLKTDVRHPYAEYQDLWMASDIEQAGASNLLIYFRPSGDARIDGAWERELARIPGFPLRQVTVRTEVNENGNSSVVRFSREITGVRTGPVPASLFDLPTGYKEVAAQETESPVP
jgi:aryl carrier-like protein